MKFRCIAADPPWNERGAGKSKRGADRHYPTMGVQCIYQTMVMAPVFQIAPRAHLWLWVTDNFLQAGLGLMAQLGFRYVRTMVWVKEKDLKLQVGLGQYLRGSHELCLLGVRGSAALPPTENRRPSVVLAPRGRHSQKPKEAFEVIEATSPGPRLEMFARQPREGWTVWGNEV